MRFPFISLYLIALSFALLPSWNLHAVNQEPSFNDKEEKLDAPKLLSVSRIWDQAEHNAFTDLIDYQGRLFCTFRESDEHAGSENGSARILMSTDGKEWKSVALLNKKGFDLRDPKFSIMPDGRLMLTLGGSLYQQDQYSGSDPLVAFSPNGVDWSEVQNLKMPGEWIWRLTWFQGWGYGVSYHPTDSLNIKTPWIITLVKTKDGLHYTPIINLDVPNHPSEATLRFLPNGTMVAFVRRQGNGWIGEAVPPYTTWKWSDSGSHLGGPDFLILPNSKMWASSRLIVKKGEEIETYTALGRLTLTSYHPELILPSGGDTSYPGMVYRNGTLYMSYYSSHEGKTSIYLAQIRLPAH